MTKATGWWMRREASSPLATPNSSATQGRSTSVALSSAWPPRRMVRATGWWTSTGTSSTSATPQPWAESGTYRFLVLSSPSSPARFRRPVGEDATANGISTPTPERGYLVGFQFAHALGDQLAFWLSGDGWPGVAT